MTRKMKDSGIERIGEIPEEWKIVKFKYVFDIIAGSGFPIYLQGKKHGKFPVCKASDIANANKYLYSAANYLDIEEITGFNVIPKNSIIMPKIGEAMKKNNRAIVLKDVVIDNNCQGIVPKKIDPKFAYYMLLIIDMNWFDNAGTIPNVNVNKLKNSLIPLPKGNIQRKISSELDLIVEQLENIEKNIYCEIEILEEYKKSLITEAVTKGLDPDVEMKDSGIEWIGKIPKHWEVVKGKYLLSLLSKPVKNTDAVITCFRDGEVTLRSNRREEGFTMADKEIGYQGIDIGDLVVHGMDGFAGAIGISDSRGKGSPVLNVLDTIGNNKKYIMYYLRSMAYNDVFTALATGIRVRSVDLRWKKLANLAYTVPPIEEQESISNYLSKQLRKTDNYINLKQQQLQILEDYKKSIIYEYVTGKKEVPHA
jgi:type I restriction enzyme S subunit